MIKNKIFTLIYRSILLTISFIALLQTTKILEGTFNTNIFIYYTNLSNIFVFIVLAIIWYYNLRDVLNKDYLGNNTHIVGIKNAATISIMVTGLVYHFLLGDPTESGFFSFNNMAVHYIIPLFFSLDWILFDKKQTIKIWFPFQCLIIPYIYYAHILIRAFTYGKNAEIVYPYFFINYNELGLLGTMQWVIILSIAFIVLGYIIWFIDKITFENNKIKIKIQNK